MLISYRKEKNARAPTCITKTTFASRQYKKQSSHLYNHINKLLHMYNDYYFTNASREVGTTTKLSLNGCHKIEEEPLTARQVEA